MNTESKQNRIVPVILEKKRFVLSPDPELLKRLRSLHEALKKAKKYNPEIISIGLFGSMTKGYATESSDIDAVLFINETKLDQRRKDEHLDSDYGSVTHYKDNFIRQLQDALQLTSIEQLKDFRVEYVSADLLRKSARRFPSTLTDLFLLSVSRDIEPYRKIVLDELESMGSEGEEIWRSIMQDLAEKENAGLNPEMIHQRELLYPKSISAAKNYFLGGMIDI